MISNLQVRKLGHREVKGLAQITWLVTWHNLVELLALTPLLLATQLLTGMMVTVLLEPPDGAWLNL